MIIMKIEKVEKCKKRRLLKAPLLLQRAIENIGYLNNQSSCFIVLHCMIIFLPREKHKSSVNRFLEPLNNHQRFLMLIIPQKPRQRTVEAGSTVVQTKHSLERGGLAVPQEGQRDGREEGWDGSKTDGWDELREAGLKVCF